MTEPQSRGPVVDPDVVIPSQGCSNYAFGESIAAHGDELLVGAPYLSYLSRANEGIPPPVACLFRRSATKWAQVEQLSAPDPSRAEGFARAVLLGASFAIVGAPTNENGDGPTHVYERSVGAPFRLRAAVEWVGDAEAFAEFGVALAADEQVLLVGARLEFGGSGAVHCFDRRASSTRPIAVLTSGRANEEFGDSVAISGDLAVIGAPAGDQRETGAAYIYRREAPDRWRQIVRLPGRRAGEQFGARVAIEGNRIAVAAPGRFAFGLPPGGGQVRLFELRGDQCDEFACLTDATGFGSALALAGNRLAVGQPTYTAPGGVAQTGRVGLYRIGANDAVSHEAWLERSGSAEYSRVGGSVALGPDYVAAGAPGLGDEDDGAGFVIVHGW